MIHGHLKVCYKDVLIVPVSHLNASGAADDLVAEARQVLHELTREGSEYAIIYIEEKLAKDLQPEIDRFKDSPSPAIIMIPGRDGSLGLGLNALKSAVERAVGTNILGD